ncbi:MAG TPA: hypothetical protein ENJ32_11120 [Crenotrichaceae bacterium]|nr:hypothetical protein [Crenotrichaceae bacterium]
METHIAWWGGLYIVVTLGFVYWTSGQEDDEDSGRWDLFYTIRDSLCYISLIAATVLFFQSLDSPMLRYIYLGLTAYIIVVCGYYIISTIREFIDDPTGSKNLEPDEEKAGLVICLVAYSIPLLFYGFGIAIAVTRSLELLP